MSRLVMADNYFETPKLILFERTQTYPHTVSIEIRSGCDEITYPLSIYAVMDYQKAFIADEAGREFSIHLYPACLDDEDMDDAS